MSVLSLPGRVFGLNCACPDYARRLTTNQTYWFCGPLATTPMPFSAKAAVPRCRWATETFTLPARFFPNRLPYRQESSSRSSNSMVCSSPLRWESQRWL